MRFLVMIPFLLQACAMREGQTYSHYFYSSATCRLGYTHTYGERIKGDNSCFDNVRFEVDDSWIEGNSVEWAIAYRVKINPDFSEYRE